MGNCKMVGATAVTYVAMWLLFVNLGSTQARVKKPYQPLTMQVPYYILPIIGYNTSDLEPFINEQTVLAHYLGHHATYQKKMNAALSEWKKEVPHNKPTSVTYICCRDNVLDLDLQTVLDKGHYIQLREPDSTLAKESIFEIIKRLDEVPDQFRTNIGNQGGGFLNHGIYFGCMSPNPANVTRTPPGKLLTDITSTFGSFEAFQEKFSQQAATLFGSGYVWLVRKSFDADAELSIVSTTNQGSPITQGMMPLLVIDVWEHAYYLKHEFRRPKYIDNWWRVVDWVNVLQMEGFWLTGAVDHELGEKLKKDEL